MKNSKQPKNPNYYLCLHEAARNYDTKLWTIPGIFLLLQAGLLNAVDFSELISFKNAIIFLADSIFSFLLWFQFEKDRLWQLLIQEEINQYDKNTEKEKDNKNSKNSLKNEKKIPLYSISPGRFMYECEKRGVNLSYFQRVVISTSIAKIVSRAIGCVAILTFILGLVIF